MLWRSSHEQGYQRDFDRLLAHTSPGARIDTVPALVAHLGNTLRISEVKAMFVEMKGVVG